MTHGDVRNECVQWIADMRLAVDWPRDTPPNTQFAVGRALQQCGLPYFVDHMHVRQQVQEHLGALDGWHYNCVMSLLDSSTGNDLQWELCGLQAKVDRLEGRVGALQSWHPPPSQNTGAPP